MTTKTSSVICTYTARTYMLQHTPSSQVLGATHSYKDRQASLPVESGALVLGVWKRQLQVWGAPASPTISLSLKETSPVPVFASVITHSGFGGRDKNFPLQHGDAARGISSTYKALQEAAPEVCPCSCPLKTHMTGWKWTYVVIYNYLGLTSLRFDCCQLSLNLVSH